MMHRRSGISEAVSASILLGAAGVAAVIIIGDMNEQAQVSTDDMRSRIDVMRAQAVEQLDITSTSWTAPPGGTGTGNYTFLVVNYGDYPTTMPFGMHGMNGIQVSNEIVYKHLNGTNMLHCNGIPNCKLYDMDLQSKKITRVIVADWPGSGGVADPLIVVTDTGHAMLAGDN